MNKTLLTFAVASIALAATSASAAITSNAITSNGWELNGLQLNGLHVNGAERNAITSNGWELNGISLNGSGTNGASVSGQKLMIEACDQKQVLLCQPRPGLRVLSVTLPSEAVAGAAMERGGSTKGTGGYNGVSLTGVAGR